MAAEYREGYHAVHVNKKKHLFDTNNEIHKYKTRNNNNLHLPVANLSKFNKGAYISGSGRVAQSV